MRSDILVLCAALICTPLCRGQSSADREDVLEVRGIQLRLGMDQSMVLQKVAAANIDAREASEPNKGMWLLCESPDDQQCDIGAITFEKGKVVFVAKFWKRTRDAFALATAFLGAAKDLEKRGYTHCELRTGETFDPLGEARSVSFKCGPHMRLSIMSAGTGNSELRGSVQESLETR